MHRASIIAVCTALLLPGVATAQCENGNFDSTYALIQAAVFERHGCTNDLCHGSIQQGGLDLRATANGELVDVPAETPPVPGWQRVLAGQPSASLLWLNLAAKTFPDRYSAPLRAMPLDPEPALSPDELEALRLWIKAGAPLSGVVPGTGDLLDACLPPPEPIEIKPLPPPAPGTGVQIVMPRWVLGAQSEREMCFASYYDVTDQVPEALRTADGKFRYKFHQTRQDPLSHHMVPVLYEGVTPPNSPLWPAFSCVGGPRAGAPCDPVATTFCGSGGICATPPEESVACIGYGPGDGGIGLSTAGISITQQTAEEFRYAPGVYRELPLKGMILWSSHAFNLTDAPGKLEAWLNFEFAQPEEQQIPAQPIFEVNGVFQTNAPAFGTDEPCSITLFPRDAQVFELSSHMHKRGKRWRTYLGAWRCAGGPSAGRACSPTGYDFASPDVCAGAACVATATPLVGDCNRDGEVSIDELISGVGIALETAPLEQCRDADVDRSQAVGVHELITAVGAALNGVPPPAPLEADDSLLYTSLVYNDPVVLRMNPPMLFNSPQQDERALTYCALYDNGFTDPSEVKQRATSPPPPGTLPIGGPCQVPTHCTEGAMEQPCSGDTEEARNRSCDTSPGAGDGFCDACPLRGGVTTEDEMFILLGQYFVR